MNCKICGAPLTGTENICPNCGNPTEKIVSTEPEVLQENQTPVVEPTPVINPTPVAPAPVVEPTPVVDPTPVAPAPVVEPTPVVDPTPVAPAPVVESTPAVTPAPVAPTPFVEPALAGQQPTQPVAEQPKKKDNKTIFLIIALVVVAIAAVVVYFTVLAPAPEAPAPTGGNDVETPVSTKTENKETYAGYTFTIPEGYVTKTDDEYGLVISNGTTGFSIAVDYSHNYDAYKKALSEKYPEQASDFIATVDGREYIALILTDTDGSQATQYVTKASDSSVFVGMVARADLTAPTTVEFSTLTTILNSSKQGTSSFAPGDDQDIGKNGEKIFTFTKDKFSFKEKED